MEEKTVVPSTGEGVDPETFRRVWQRVMPDQTGSPLEVENGPAAVPDTARPAVPTQSGETGEGAGEESGADLPPVPACAQEGGQEGESAPCVCQGTPSQCLGESSAGETARLEELMGMARRGMLAGQALARRGGSACARSALRSLADDHRYALRRLSAAYFLITGRRYRPCGQIPALPADLCLALREQFQWERRWAFCAEQGAQAAQDPCLKELYQELAREGACHAGAIRSLLEQMA